jgi:trigger factor
MSYKLTPHVNHTVEITGRLEAAEVDQQRQAIANTLRRKAVIPGFRPGKAPLALVKSRFASDIEDELKERLAGVLWTEIVDGEEDLQPLHAPRVSSADFDDDGGFSLAAEVEVRPRYELAEAEGLSLPEVALEVGDDEVTEELDNIRKENASWEPLEDTPAEDGLMVEADLKGEMIDGDQDPYTEENARFVVGAPGVPEEVSEALQGAKVGDERIAERRFPEDDDNSARAGKLVRYQITVKGIKREVLPEADDDLAKTVGFDTMDELRERIVEVLGHHKRAKRRDAWRRSLLDQLEEKIDVDDLPSSLVQSAINEEMQRLAYSMAMQGVTPDSGKVNWQEMATRFEPQARRKVLDTLVLEQLADAWEMDVPESDVDAFIASEAGQLGIPPAEHKANLAREGKLDGVRHAARISATVEELIRRAGGEEES